MYKKCGDVINVIYMIAHTFSFTFKTVANETFITKEIKCSISTSLF